MRCKPLDRRDLQPRHPPPHVSQKLFAARALLLRGVLGIGETSMVHDNKNTQAFDASSKGIDHT